MYIYFFAFSFDASRETGPPLLVWKLTIESMIYDEYHGVLNLH